MLTYIEGNLFLSTAQTLVNTVNTAGVMGKGIARDFKSFYPTMFAEYKRACDAGTLVMGSLLLYRTAHKWVLNFPTKRHWRQASRLSDIEQRLETFQRTYAEQGISSIAFPQLGCGQGGLDWESEVRPLMERYLGALPVDVFVHVPAAPSDAPSVSREEIADWLTAIPALMRYADFRDDVLAQATAHGSAANGLHAIDWRGASGETDDLFDLWRQLRSSGYLLPDDVPVMLGAPAEPFFEHLTRMPYVQRARVVRQPSISYDDGSIDSLFGLPEAQGVQFVPPQAVGRTLAQAPIADEGALASGALAQAQTRGNHRSRRVVPERVALRCGPIKSRTANALVTARGDAKRPHLSTRDVSDRREHVPLSVVLCRASDNVRQSALVSFQPRFPYPGSVSGLDHPGKSRFRGLDHYPTFVQGSWERQCAYPRAGTRKSGKDRALPR